MKNLYTVLLCLLTMLWSAKPSQAHSFFSSITGNTIGTDQTICNNTTPAALTGSLPGGGTGVFTYQWQSSTTSAITGFTSIAPNGTNQGYVPPGALTANRWYRRIVASGIEKDTTAAVMVTVTPVITAASNVITASQTICYNTTPAPLAGPTATGGNGVYVYQWQSSPDNLTYTNITGANGTGYAPGVLTAPMWYKRVVSSGGCTITSAAVAITVTPVLTAGTNTIGSNQGICNGQTPVPFAGSTPTGGTGGYTYLWESSTTSATAGFSTAAGTSNGKNYTPLALTQTTWFHRIVMSGGCADTSATVLITVANSSPGNPAVFGNNVWNVYGYSDNAFGTYAGYYTEPLLSFRTTARYTSAQSPSFASGYQGCQVPLTNFSVSMKQTNFTPGIYQIALDSLDDNLNVFLNGTQIYVHGCCVTTVPVTNIWTGYLGAPDQMELKWTQATGPSFLNMRFIPASPAPLVPGGISQDKQVCYGEVPPAGFTSTAPPTTGCSTLAMQWQKSIDSVTWVPIVGATALTYTETAALIQTTWYRRMATDACLNAVATAPIKVTVNVVAPGDPTVYGNNTWNVYVFQGTGAPGPYNAAVYKGYYTEPLLSFDSKNRWTNTASPSNASGYQGCVVNVNNTWIDYKRTNFTPAVYQIDIPYHDDAATLFINGIQVFTHNGCCDSHTNVWTGPLGPTDQVEYRVSQGGGPSSEALTLTAVTPPVLTAGAIVPSQTICAGNVPPTPFTESVAPTGGCTIKNYSWDYSTDNGATWNLISGATGISYTATSSVYSQMLFRRTVYDVCGNSAIAIPDTVYMNNTAPGNPAVFGNNTWNVYCFQDISYSIYAGYYTEPLLTFQTTNRYPSTSPPSTASGYLGCQLINTYYSVSMKRTGFTAGLYQIDVTSDDDYNLIYINGVLVSSLNYPTIQNNVWTGNLGPTDQVEVRWRNNAGPGQTGVRFTIVTPTPLFPGSIVAYNPNLCYNDLPIINEVTPASGGCFVNYSWQSSTDGGTTWVTIAGATGNNFTGAVSPTVNIQYRRVASDVCGAVAYSAPVTFTQTAGTVGNPAVYGNAVWNVYAYDAAGPGNPSAFSTAQYLGYYVEPLLSFNSLNRWGTNNAPSDASGYQGCQVDQDNHWVSYRQTNITPGTYQIDIPYHDDDAYLFINGVQVWSQAGCCVASTNVWTGTISATDQIEFRWREYYGGSSGAVNFTLVTPPTTIIPGTIAAGQTICANTIPAAFTSATDATSSCYVNYQWQSSPDGITWTDISGATSNVYASPAVAAKTYFQRKATNSCGTIAYSNTINVDVYPIVVTAGSIATDQTICSGTVPGAFTSAGLPTGGNGTYTYQWQSSLDNIGWSNIAGATGVTYTPVAAITTTTYYRRNVSSCGTLSVSSNSVKVTVNALVVITTQPANPSACTGGSTTVSVAATGAGLTYQWQVNTGSGFTNVSNVAPYSGATTNLLTINPVTAGMAGYKYQVIITGTCAPVVTSNIVTLAVSNNALITTQPANKTFCAGTNATFSVNASGTGITYQWQQNISGTWTNLVDNAVYSGTLTTTLTVTGVTVGMTGSIYRCVLNTTCPGLINSNQATMTVVAQPTNTITADQTVCAGIAPAALAGSAAANYLWQSSTVSPSTGFVTASGTSNGQNYTPGIISTTTYYQRIAGNGTCTNTSNVVTITVNNAAIVITTQPVNQAICAGGNASFTATASGPGTLSYQWYENGVGLVDGGVYSGSTTNTLTLTGATAGMNGNTYYLKVFASGCSASSNNTSTATLTTSNAPIVLTNAPSFTTCTGSSVQLNMTAKGVGITYQWQVNTGSGWNNLSNLGSYSNVNGNSLRINPTTASMDGYQYRVIVSGTCAPFTATSAITTMNVNGPVTNNTISNSQTLCAGTPAPFTGSTPSGGTGTFTYQWYLNSGSGWFAIGGATGINYASGALAQTTQFYRVVTSGACAATTSPAITVTILPPTSTTDPGNTTVCAGTNATFTVVGTGSGLSYQWQVNTGSGWLNIINGASYTGVTTATLNVVAPPFSFNGYQYRCIVGGGCAPLSVTSAAATLTVSPVAIITAQPSNVNTCAGGNATYTVTATGSGISYQWMEKVSAGVFTNITNGGIYSGATSPTLTLSGVTVGMNNNQYMCVITIGTCPVNSLIGSLTVSAQPSLVITNPATICAPGTVDITAAAVTAGSNLAGGTLTYWNNITFTSPLTNPTAVAVAGTYYIRVATSAVCYDIKPVVVSITPTIINNNISASQAICTGSTPVGLTGTAPGGGTSTYTYQWQQSTDNVTYSNIVGATNPNYAPGALSVTTYYKRIVNSGTCTGTSTAVQITVVAYPTATISYPGTPFCATGSVAVSQSGQTGGTYTVSPSGLIINSTTGAITLTGSTPNSYTVTYSFSNGTCSGTTTAPVTVNALPTATIDYPGSPYCATGFATVTQTGTPGGIYTAPAGLVIDAAGTVNLSTSTLGTYAVTYTFNNGTCSNSYTKNITINALPTATIVYAGSPYCATGTANVTQSGPAGGTYSSSPAGLSINTTTGAVNLGLSTPSATPYTVTYTFTNGTCGNSTTTSITVNPLPSVVITNPAAVCSPATVNLTVAAVTAGSTSGLTYTYYTDAAGTITLAGPAAVAVSGTYYIKGTTAAGCTDIEPVVVTINPKPSVVITNPAAVCAPATVDITLTAVTAGSTAGLTYTYFTNAAGTTVLASPGAVAASGTYYIKGSTAAGCSDIQPVVVTVNPKPTVVITNPAAVCSPATVNLTLAAVTTGSTAGLTYTYFTDAAGTITLATPAAIAAGGTYYIKGTLATGCSDIKPVVVTINPKPTVVITNPAAVCAPGTVDITVAAVTAGSTAGLTYTYFTNAAGTTVLASPGAVAASGTYYIKGTTAAGCTDIQPVVVTINPKPTVVIVNPAAVCAPATVDITVAAVTAGSTAGLTFTYFTDAAGTITLTTPAAITTGGTYYIRGTLATGCSDIKPVTVTINPKPTVVITNPAAVCSPATVNLTLAAVTTGSTAGLTYSYFTNAAGTTALASPNAVAVGGTYYIKGTTAAGCSDIQPVVVTINPKPTVVITNPAAVCSPATVDITVAAVTAGSTAGLTFTYFTNAAGTIVLASPGAVVASGTYYIKGTTAAGCSDIQPVVVTVNPKPTVVITNPAAVCSPATVNLTLAAVTTGSTAGLTYTYFTDAAGTITLTTPAAVAASGTYYIKGTLASGCSDIKPVTVTINPKPAVVITNPAAVCAPGTVDITLAAVTTGSTAGLTYTYFTNAAGTTVLASPNAVAASGTYYIKGTTAAGCSDIQPVVVTINPKPTVVITNPAAVCAPGTVDITPAAVTAGSTAGLTYTYFTDAAGTITLPTPTAVAAGGTYYIRGTLATGCSDIKPVVVTINPKPTVVITNPAAVCSPATVNLTLAAVTTGSTAGLTYTYFTDAAGTITLAGPAAVGISGTYYIKGTTAAGCSDIKPVVVTINPKPTVVITNPAAVCAPSTVDITVAAVTAGSTAGLTFTYFTNAAGTTVLASPGAVAASGTYYIKGTTASGCSDIQPVVVTINPKPTVVIVNPAAVCAPSTVDLTAAAVTTGSTAGLTFTYFTDAAGTLVLASPNAVATGGTYYIRGTLATGCSDIKPVVVTINPKPTVVITNPAAVCSPATVNLTLAAVTAGSTAGLTYTYFTNAAGTTVLASPNAVAASGTYYIKGTTASGCSDIQPVVVTINPKPTVVITNPAAVCSPATVDITVAAVTTGSTAGLTFTYFTNAAGTIVLASPNAVAASGTYYIKGTTASGCSDIQPVVVTINPKPTLVIVNPAAVCSPATIDLTAAAVTAGSTAGLTYTYFTDAAGTIVLASPNAVATSGTYYIKGTLVTGCSDIKPVTVTINPKPSVVITNPAAVCSPATVNLTLAAVTSGSTAGLTYTYFTNAAGTTVLASPNAVAVSGTYYIKGTTASGCSDIQPVVVTINPKPTVVITNPAAVCAPATVDITAAAVTTGSTAGLTYTYFTNAAGTTVLSSPNAVAASGTYYIKGTTASGCTDIQPVVVTINPLPSATIAYTGTPYCATGTASVTRTGQAGGTYTAPGGVVINNLTGDINLGSSTPGINYLITYTFSNGTCSNSTTATITINALPTATISYAGSPYCATGTANVTQSGQTGGTYTATPAGLSINLTTGSIDLGASTPSATPYTVTYAFTNGTCSSSTTAAVLINALPTVTITNPAAVCSPSTVDITAPAVTAGSTAALTYTYFTDAAGTLVLASPNAVTVGGTYYIKGTTAAGCSAIKPVVVTINPKPTVVITNPAPVCAPSTVDITAAAVTTGSTAGLTYTYFTNAAGTIVLASPNAVAASGTYYIKGTTASGCSDIQPVIVTINPKPTVVITNPAAVCAPATVDITVAAVTAGSTAGLTYTYFTNAAGTTVLASPNAVAASGTYYIKGTTASGCSDIQPVIVTINPKPTVVITNPPAVCAPATIDLTLAAVTTGSTAGLTFTYFTNAAGTTVLVSPNAVAASGTYYIKGTTASGCSDIQPVIVTINPKPTVVITNPPAVCAPATIDLTLAAVTTGSTAGLTYTYFTNAAGTTVLASPNAVSVSGTYYIKGTLASGCSDIQPVVVTINPLPAATIIYPGTPYCASGTANVTLTGQTGGTFSSTPAGLSLDVTTGAVNLGLSVPGPYTVTYSYTNGTCSSTTPASINIITAPSVVITNPPAGCTPSTVDITAAAVTAGSTAGLTYTYFTDAAGTITMTTPAAVAVGGTYYIKGSAGSGCSDIKPVVVSFNPKPTVVITNPAAVCAPATVDITAAAVTTGSTAGLTYTYFTNAAGTTVLASPNAVAASGTYYIKGTTASGCSDIKPVLVTINPKPSVVITNPAAVCAPSTVDLTAAAVTTGSTAGLTYTYFTNAAGTTVLASPNAVAASGTYYIKGTTASGCSDIQPVVVTINPKPTVVITNPAAACAPATVDITVAAVTTGSTAGLTYTYFTNAAGTTVLASPNAVAVGGTYYIKGTTASGCSDIQPVVVTINPKPSVVINNPAAVCSPSTVDITAAAVTTGSTAGLTYSYFTDAAGTIILASPNAVAASGTYYIKGTSASGCSDIQPVLVTINPKPSVVITNPAAVCAPSTVDITTAAVTTGSTAGLTYSYFTDAAGTIILASPNAVAASGTYYIKGTSASGCSDIQPVVVTINPKPTVVITNPAAVCSPATVDLTAAAVTAGSTAGLTYTYFTNAAGTTVLASPNAVAASGTYYIKGTTVSGCSDIKPVVVTINPLPLATIAYAGTPYCLTGTATVTQTGQTGGIYTAPAGIVINNTTGDINLGSSTPGINYLITYTFSNGTCSNTATTSITINALPTASIAYAGSPYCATGTANVTQSGQTGGTYAASPAGLSINLTTGAVDLGASTPSLTPYTVTYSFGNGICSNSTTATILINALPTVTITNPTAVCAPATIDLTAAAVTAGSTASLTYTYFTDAAGTLVLASPNAVAASGTYYIKGTTAAGCSDIKPVVVTINPKPTVVITNPAAVCAPATVDITVAGITTGSTAGLTYTYFTDAAGTVTLSTPSAIAAGGTYYIKGSTASGCSDIQPVIVTINLKPSVVITNPPAACPPATIDITAATVTAGSTAGLTYTYFTDAAGTSVLANANAIAVAGTYYIKGTTASGCTDIQPVVVSFNILPTATITYTASPYCATGTAAVTLTGQTGGIFSAPAGVVIDPVTGTIDLLNSTAGNNYIITYTFSNGTCSNSTTAVITINALPKAAIFYSGSPYCATGTATVTQSGQTGGTYTATPSGLSISPITGAIDLGASTPSATAYTVTYAFTNGTCTNSTTTTVLINALPTVVITNPAAVCAPATIDLTDASVTAGSTAGLTYTYFTDAAGTLVLATPAAIATGGTYYIKGTAGSGCSAIQPVVVTINPQPSIVITNPPAVCAPATVDITTAAITAGSTAGLTYAYFTDAAGTISVSTPAAITTGGTYYIRGTTALGCSDIQPVLVTINPKPVVVTTNPSPVCPPATIDLTDPAVTAGSTAGLTYTYFTDAAGTVSLANANAVALTGTYYIRGTTAAGCSDIQPVVVSFNALPVATILYPASPYCKTGTATVNLTGQSGGFFTAPAGVVINNTTGDIDLGASPSGTYQIDYTSSNGICSGIASTSITINALPVATINYPGSPYCAVNTATVIQAGQSGGTYSSSAGLVIDKFTGTIDLGASSPSATPYTVVYTFGNGTCTNITTALVTVKPLPVSTIAYTGTPYCKNGTAMVTLTGTGGGTFSASPGGLSLTGATGDINLAASAEGAYTVIYNVTSGGCSYSTSTPVVIKNPTLVIHNPAGVCSPGTVDLTDPSITTGSAAGLTYSYYQDNAGTIPLLNPASVGSAGNYFIEGTNTSTGCSTNIQPVLVTLFAKPTVTASSSTNDICKGTVVTLTAVSPGNTIDWPGVGAGNVVTVAPLDSTQYLAVATTPQGCKDTATVDINVNAFKLSLTANPDPVLAGTNTTLTTNGNFAYNVISWSPDVFFADQTATSQTIVVKDTSKSFTVIAQSVDGCLDTATLFVVVDPNMKDFFIPNSFSPNGDGTNDIFKAYGSSVKEVTMRVYNQWGQLIFESQNMSIGWDGTWNGRPQMVGVYVYVAQVTFYNGVTTKRKGTINLIR